MPDDSTTSWGRRSFLKATGAAGAAGAVGASNVTAGRGQSPGDAETETLLVISDSVNFERAVERIRDEVPGDVTHTNSALNFVAVDKGGLSAQAADHMETQAEKRPEVKTTTENVTLEAHAADDPLLDEQYAPQQTNATDAWEQELGSDDVSIAIVDTGAQYTHETLEERFDSSNPGQDFAGGDDDPSPGSADHGTHVAGIASATTDNGTGVAGQANCQLYSVRVLGGGGGGSLSDIADGIQWAADQGVDVINMSLGGGGSNDVMKNAVSYAWDRGVLVLASAGNSGDRGVSYPSAYDEVMSVSAIDDDENLARFSQYGPEVEITGPGVNVLSTVPNDDYSELSGTSMSCPAVSGVAALGKSANQNLSNTELRAALKETARDVGLSSEEQGAGCADALALVEEVGDGGGGDDPEEPPDDPEEPPEEPPDDPEQPTAVIDASTTTPAVGEEVTFDGTGSSSPNGNITEYAWNAQPGGSATGAEVVGSWDESGSIDVSLTITDEVGETASDSVTVEVGGDDGPECGEETGGGSADGSISWWNSSDVYTYAAQTSNPCQLEISLDGPSGADFDLFVTLDGRTPTPRDFDLSSTTPDANETVLTDQLQAGQEIGIRVEGISGGGSYTISADEVGF